MKSFNRVFATLILALVLTPLLLLPGAGAKIIDAEHGQLRPSAEQRFASRLATRFFSGYHYHRENLSHVTSERIFDQYLRVLDPNREYFLASDIRDFERYRDHLEEALRTSELEPAFEIFNRYVRRVGERAEHARSLLNETFDFTVDESYQFDRSEADWAADQAELDEIWRKRVKNDWLRLLLAEREAEDIVETLTNRYNNLERRVRNFKSEDVFQFFMNAYARTIEPHSAYMSPRSAENFEISMRLSLEGIGALLQQESDYTTIREIVPGGPADLDGRLKEGDRIVGVGQGEEGIVDVVGWRLDDVVDLIRGPRETTVNLEVLPAETGLNGPPQIIDIVRNEVRLENQAATGEMIELPIGDEVRRIGVIQVPVFYVDFQGRARNEPNYRSSTRDVRRIINELREEGMDGLVLDLRGNGGGALVEATTMTGLFIDEGPVVQVRDSSGRVSIEADREPGMAWDGPLAVLVNRRSASASEILAAAIQDYGRGVVLGEPTFGKGTVQNLINLDEISRGENARLGQLKLTMAQFYRIHGGSTQSKGVVPDILLPSAGDPAEYGESALENAMPWTSIDPTEFTPVADLSPLLPLAEQRHLARREQHEDLVSLIEDLAEWEAVSQRDSVSLLESVRREEMAAGEERRRSRLGLTHTPGDVDSDEGEPEHDEAPDVLLNESARILADLIDLDRDQHLLAHRGNLVTSAVD